MHKLTSCLEMSVHDFFLFSLTRPSFHPCTEECQKKSFIFAVSSCRTNHSGLHGCTVNRIKSPMARAKASRAKRGRPVADTAHLGWRALGHYLHDGIFSVCSVARWASKQQRGMGWAKPMLARKINTKKLENSNARLVLLFRAKASTRAMTRATTRVTTRATTRAMAVVALGASQAAVCTFAFAQFLDEDVVNCFLIQAFALFLLFAPCSLDS